MFSIAYLGDFVKNVRRQKRKKQFADNRIKGFPYVIKRSKESKIKEKSECI